MLALGAAVGSLAALAVWFTTRLRGDRAPAVAPSAGGLELGREGPAPIPFHPQPAEAQPEAEPGSSSIEPAAATPRRSVDAPARESDAIRIEGRVAFPLGTPRDEAVRIRFLGATSPGRPAIDESVAEVDADGRFGLAVTPTASKPSLRLEARYLVLDDDVRVDARRAPEALVLEPRLGGRIAGRAIVASSRVPSDFEGASARISAWPTGREPIQRDAAIAPDGRFELDALPPRDDYWLTVSAPGFVDATLDHVVVRAGEVTEPELALEAGATLRGRVLDPAGAPLAGAEVGATTTNSFVDSPTTTTAADGSFALTAVVPGEVTLTASQDGLLSDSLELPALASGELREGIVLRLADGLAIEGVVQWPDGRSAARAAVRWTPGDLLPPGVRVLGYGDDGKREVDADEAGRFRIGGIADTRAGVLRASARPDASEASAVWRASLEGVRPPVSGLRLVLESAPALRGRVVDDLGNPVERFRVRAWRLVNGQGTDDPLSRRIQSANGEFAFEGLERGAWLVSADPVGFDFAISSIVRVELPRDEPIELRAPRTAFVEGRVQGPRGEAIARAVVELVQDDPVRRAIDGSSGQARTNDEGRFRFTHARPGRLALIARADGFPDSKPFALELAPGSEAKEIVLEIPAGAELTGEIHPAAGSIADRAVYVSAVDGPGFDELRSDARGRFAASGLAPGRYEVSMEREAGDPLADLQIVEPVELVGGRATHVVLGAPRAGGIRVSGRVVADGAPLAAALLVWQSPGAPREGARTSESGEYAVALSRPGAWTATIVAGGEWLAVVPVDLPEAPTQRADFVVPSGSISGRVLDGAQRPLERVLVRAQSDERLVDGEPRCERGAYTDADGRYVLPHLAQGTYAVAAGGPEMEDGSGSPVYGLQRVAGVSVEDGARHAGVDLVLRTPGSIVGTLLRATGEPLVSARIDVVDAASSALLASVPTERDGSFRFDALAAGSVRVRAEGAQEVGARVVEGETVRVELVLR